jgi:hypothetical protein
MSLLCLIQGRVCVCVRERERDKERERELTVNESLKHLIEVHSLLYLL